MPRARAHKPGFFTRPELMLRWGSSEHQIRKLERCGTLPVAEIGYGGTRFYSDLDVRLIEQTGLHTEKRIRKRTPANLIASAFEMFKAGKSMPDIVIALRLTPDVVDKYYAEYRKANLESRLLDKQWQALIPDIA